MRTGERVRPRVVVAVSTAAVGFGPIIGFTPGFIATALRADLGIDRLQVGLLISVHFCCTSLGSLAAGRATDRWGARYVVVADMLLVALAGLLAWAWGTYAALLLAAVLSGFGYALTNVGTNVAVSRVVGPRRRAVALSAKTAGAPAVAVLSAAAGPWASERWGWEWVLALLGICGAVIAVLAATALPDDRPERAERVIHAAGSLPRGFGWFPVAAFLMISGSQPIYAWSVPYLEESLGESATLSGALVAIASAIGAGFMVVAGLQADRVDAGGRIRLIISWCVAAGVSSILILAGGTFGTAVAALGVIGGIGFQLAAIGTLHAAIVDRAGPAVARATAVTMTGYYLGAVAGPVASGAFIDAVGSYGWAWLASCVCLVAGAASYRMAGRVVPQPNQRSA